MESLDQLPELEDGDWHRDDEVYAVYSQLRVPVPTTRRASVGNKCYVKVGDETEITHITSFPSLAIVQQHPIIDTIILLSDILQNLGKQLTKEVIIRRLLESQLPHIVHVNGKLL